MISTVPQHFHKRMVFLFLTDNYCAPTFAPIPFSPAELTSTLDRNSCCKIIDLISSMVPDDSLSSRSKDKGAPTFPRKWYVQKCVRISCQHFEETRTSTGAREHGQTPSRLMQRISWSRLLSQEQDATGGKNAIVTTIFTRHVGHHRRK